MDANQSINVSYVDKAGKTIATCLSKEPGKNLEPLASAAQANFNIEYFLTGGVAGADPYEIVETKTIPIGKPTTLNFEYKLEQKKIEYLCKTLCTTCDYVVDFKVVFEEEPNVVLWQNSVTIDPTTIQCNNLTGTLDPIPFDNPAVPPSFLASEFGNYIVTKTVRYHNNNAASIPYIDEYTNTLQQAIDASVYSASADWIVCDAAGLPITGLPQISIYDLSTKLSNKMMTGANGVYSMLGINPINNIPVVRILKKDPLVAGGQSPCDAKFSLTITPCPEVTCPDPLIFEDQLISMFQDALNYHNGTYPACTMSTNLMDHFIVYNQVYTIEFSGQQIQLDGNDMKTVIDNMIYDYNHQNIPNDVGKNYSCENILAAWEMAIEAYFSEAASICQNPTNAAVAANNGFLDKFFTTIGYRLVGSTHLPSQAGGYGYKTHPYRCFFMPDQWNPNPPGSNVFTYINANPSTAFSAAILNGNSLHNAAKPVTCPFLPLPTNPSDIAGYFDPNYGILDLQVIQPCDKSEATLLNFYRAIQYQLNANLFSVFGIPSGATYDNLLSLKQQNERLCRRICQANHDMYEDAITTEFALPSLNNASVGLVEDYQVPLGYSSNSSLLPARNNIAINWVETYAQMAVDNCKSKCNLTIQGTNCPGPNCVMTAIGTPEEQAEFMKATTMGAKIYLTTSFENVNPTTQMPDREYWMSLYNDPCVSCMDFKGNPINGGGGCDENEVQNNTISLYPLSNIDGFLYKSRCPTLAPTNVLSIYPMEHIDYNRDVISQNSYQSNYLAFSPDKETGVAYDLMPWLTQKLNAQIANGPATGTLNIYDMVYNYVNPVSDDLSASNAIAHTFSADDNAAGSEQLESDPGVGGHKKTISYNNLGFDMMVGVKTFVTNSVTANLIPLTIKRTHSTQLAMHGYMKVKVEVTPPAGYVGDVTYKDILNDYTTSNHKIAFIIDNPREIYTSGNEVIMTKSFSPLNTKPLVLEYLVRIKKSNFSPFETNEINNSDLLAITSAAIPLPNQAEYPVHYARGLVATSGAFVAVGPAYEVNIPSLRIYNPQIKPDAQVLASFATGPNPEDDIQNAYTVTNTGIIPGNVPPEMSVNKYVQVVALSYNSLEVEIDPKTKNPKIDANGNPIVNQVTNVLWPYFNNHKVFQPASICMQYIPFQIKDSMDQLGPTSCNDALANDLLSSLSDQVQDIKDAAVQELKSKYYNICSVYGLNDELKVWYKEGYHHYTLYYYNRAGNLIRTVAPEGVDCVPKANDRNTLQKYKQATLYDYNSLNQVVKSRSQDGGETQFIYDNLGRLRFSQNAKQLLNGKCSYMKYDELGRVTESGEHSFAGAFSVLQSQAGIITYPTSNIREVVRTVYTNAYPINYLVGATPQQNLLNRVSYTVSMKDPTAATALLRGEVVNVFSYDLSGNAVWTAQKIMDLPFNYMRYEFDMLSGAVLKTVYNEGAVDAFYHRYQYDANKKLLCVETSQDGYQWDKDARYTYYKHGPLKNTIIGHDKIQSVDYAYTINGWLKAINHPGLSKEKNADYLSNVNTAMNDVFATKIQYFPTDFTRTGSPYNFTETGPNAYNYVPTTAHDLYNGNISAILTSNVSSLQSTVSDNAVKFHVNDYHFD
ncbi:MAG TPA: hypothetical protein PLU10_06335, partial [Chitinophagaceae bacterium]|nr:hypothetical protein [Chitinophagaceae bacterium]